jgi:periplasmic divalent cation tolerance protein
MKLIAVYTTTGTIEEAREIASSLVQQRLVACAQISEIESFYTWNTTLQNTREFRLTLKTTEAQYSAVEAVIRAMHSYEVPAIYAVAVQIAYAPYAAWVEETSAGK